MRLIDADALKADYIRTTTITNTPCCLYVSKEQIDNAPTIEAEPIRYGEWIDGRDMMYCSECAETYDKMYKLDLHYCPNCGAHMDEEET